MWRHAAQTQLLAQLLPRVGEIQAVRASFFGILPRADDIRFVPELGGGALPRPRLLLLQRGTARARRAGRVYGEAWLGRGGVDERFAGTLRFGDVVATFQCGFTARTNQIEVVGSDGVLLVPQAFVNPPGVVLLDGEEHRVEPGDHYRVELDDFCAAVRGEHPPLIGRAEMLGQARVLDALLRSAETGSAFLARVEQALRVEGLLQPQVQVVARRAELVLELAALQPADPVLARDRAAEAQGELEQLVTGSVGAALLIGVVGREEERRVDVAVARVPERQRRHVVPGADLERLARDIAQPVERHGDVLAERATALREDREGDAAAPPPQLGDLGRLLGCVHGDGVVRERLAQLGGDAARLVVRSVGFGDDHERAAVGQCRTGTRRPSTRA